MKGGRAAILAAALCCAGLGSGCVYYNTIYNAGQLYDRAEASRRAGRDVEAERLYREVVAKTSDAYRARPASGWAGEALFLLGRSRLRLGELDEAERVLLDALAAGSPELRGPVTVYLAAVMQARGDDEAAIELLNQALGSQMEGPARAEAHMLRARWVLTSSLGDHGWWDLDRAAEVHPDARVEAGLERLIWSVRLGDPERAADATHLLFQDVRGGDRSSAIEAAVDSAAARWGAGVAAGLLDGAESARWDRDTRGRLRLKRARLLNTVGDTAGAAGVAWEVAGGLGEAAAEARLLLARWQLERTEDLADAYGVRGILLPAGSHPEAAELIGAVDELEELTDIGLARPLGWFAAAEVARDRLEAHYLARGLFLAYADGAPEQPWAPKALLAALEVSTLESDREWLRGRLEAHSRSPYVLAALGGSGAGFETLEEELGVRLRELRSR